MSVKSFPLSPVQTIASQYIFAELSQVTADAKAKFALVVKEAGGDPEKAGVADFSVINGTGVVSYSVVDPPQAETGEIKGEVPAFVVPE